MQMGKVSNALDRLPHLGSLSNKSKLTAAHATRFPDQVHMQGKRWPAPGNVQLIKSSVNAFNVDLCAWQSHWRVVNANQDAYFCMFEITQHTWVVTNAPSAPSSSFAAQTCHRRHPEQWTWTARSPRLTAPSSVGQGRGISAAQRTWTLSENAYQLHIFMFIWMYKTHLEFIKQITYFSLFTIHLTFQQSCLDYS